MSRLGVFQPGTLNPEPLNLGYNIIAVSIVTFIGRLIFAIRWLGSAGFEDSASSSEQSIMRLNESSRIGSLQQKEYNKFN